MRALDECVIGWAVGLVFSTGAGVGSCCFSPEEPSAVPCFAQSGGNCGPAAAPLGMPSRFPAWGSRRGSAMRWLA